MRNFVLEQHSGYQTITMNWTAERPGFQRSSFDAVTLALKSADNNPDVSSTIFFGVPHCFCLGTDASVLAQSHKLDELHETVQTFFRALINSKKPLIAAVDGPAVGLGMTMLCHFDAILATPSSTFKAPFVDWGLSPEAGSSILLPEILGYKKAFDIFCLGGELSGEDAEKMGLITRLVQKDDLVSTTHNIAKKIAKAPHRSLSATRDLLRQQRTKLVQRTRTETTIFQDLLGEPSTQRKLKVMARATKMALAS